jgi:hypothetical protein
MLRRGVVVGVLTAVAGALVALPASANHSWGGYHWARASNPFTVNVVDSVTPDWDGYLDTAISDWSSTAGPARLVKQAGSTSSRDRRRCAAVAGNVRVCNYTYGFNGWLGVASIWVNGLHITQGTVKMNDSYFNTSTYNTPPWRRLVMCQEPGHTLGLDHQDENFSNPNLGTCMDYTNDPDGPPSNEHPNQHDYDELNLIYAHSDGGTLAVEQAPGGKSKPTRVKDSLWVRDLGAGHKQYIWVYWADRTAQHPDAPAGT